MNSTIATEALVQRGRTPLYNDLVYLYQETQDALRELKKASPAKINIQLKYIDYPKKLKALITKHMGLVVTKVDIVESRDANAYATIDLPSTLIDRIASGKKSFQNILEKVNSVYDTRTASLQKDIPHEFGFHFGIHIGFWRMRNKDGSFFFSAEELAAVTLHEIGHFDHWIRTLSKSVGLMLDASDLIDYVKDKPDQKVILQILDNLKKSKFLDRSWEGILKTTDKYFRAPFDYTEPEYSQAIEALETMIVSELGGYAVVNLNAMAMWGVSINTQTPETSLYGIDAERSADEFASRNGSYSALASALKKMNEFNDTNSYYYVRQFMWAFPGIFVSALAKFSALLYIPAEDISFGYDPIIRRLELIAQTAKHAFAEYNLPPPVKADMLAQIKEVELYIRQRERSPYRLLRRQIKEWKESVSKLGRIAVSPLHSRLYGDYHRLQDANRNLGRHSLYYLSKK